MAGFVQILRSGDWVTRERMRLVALLLIAFSVAGAVFLVATSDGRNDSFGRPLGTDFSNVYAAGTYVLDGEPTAPFSPPRQFTREQAIFGKDTPYFGWHYPPFFLAVAALLALMPYGIALIVWQGVTLVLYLLAIRAILLTPSWPGLSRPSTPSSAGGSQDVDARHKAGHDEGAAFPPGSALRAEPPAPFTGGIAEFWLMLALAFPAVIINIGHGHNGFLTTALFAGGLVLLDRRPWLAGLLFGCLVYKPQFGLLIPLVLAATWRWRAFASATLTVAVLALATTLAFGAQVWTAFLASAEFTRAIVLEQGGTGWHKIQSMFSLVRMWGGGISLAYGVQIATALFVAFGLIWLWRSPARFAWQSAALLIGTILATPYSLDYDLVLLAPAIAYLAADGIEHGFRPWEKTIVAALWIVPLITRNVALTAHIPLAVPLMLLAFCFLLRCAMADYGLWRFTPRPVE